MGVAVAAVVFLLEVAEEILADRDIEFVSLAAVTNVDAAVVVRSSLPAFLAEIFGGRSFQSRKFVIQLLGWNFSGDPPENRSGIIFDDIARQNAHGRERAG